MVVEEVCRLCADCRRACKQSSVVVVVNCPRYERGEAAKVGKQGCIATQKGRGNSVRGELR